ncbi:CBS domain-containing protein [Candidatus Nitrosotenuis cloacae]|uniref:CBS domain-containing protein n=1 Tax=Candidatus Nitrosotenuis cloacae TaxID=1603555 RepID=UPI002282DF2A|nr:CBS domain-containing protein [Candidatus Nitrosotenuis cloacae]
MKISECTLRSLLPVSMTTAPCVSIQRHAKVDEAVGLLVPYLESMTDSLVVTGDNNEPIGIVGGREIIEKVLSNPSKSMFESTIDGIMSREVTKVSGTTKIREIIEDWKRTGRAFSIIPNALGGYSVISARKLLEVGKISMTDMKISEIPEKKTLTFKMDATVGDIINMMLKHQTRKILLENTNQFISDRIIIEKIVTDFEYLKHTADFLNLPITNFGLEYAKVISKDLMVNELSSIMFGMMHPYVVFKGHAISPWDICLALLSDKMEEYP